MRLAIVGAAGCAAAIIALSIAGWPASVYRQNDYFQFWAAPHSVVEGRDPYDLAWWVAIHEREGSGAIVGQPQTQGAPLLPFVYPLWTALAFVPLALLPLTVAAAAWLVAQLALVFAAQAAFVRAALPTRALRSAPLLGAFALGFQPLWLLVVGGNMTGWVFAAFWLGVVAALAGRSALAGALLGLVLLKPNALFVAAPAALLALPTDRRRALLGAGAVGLSLLVASELVRPAWPAEWLPPALGLQGATVGSNATAWTLDRLVPGAPRALVDGAALALVLASLGWWWWKRRPPREVLVSGAVAVSLFVAPHGWSYDQLLLLPVAAILVRAALGYTGVAYALALAAIAAVFDAFPWALYALAFGRGGEELSAVTPLLVFGLVVLADRLASREAAVGARVRLRPGTA